MSEEIQKASAFNFKSILLVISLILNALGGSGIIPPVVGGAPSHAPASGH